MMTLREISVELADMAAEVRRVSASVLHGGAGPDRWAIARDLEATAHTLDRAAECAARVGRAAGEPDPYDLSWIPEAAPGGLTEIFGR